MKFVVFSSLIILLFLVAVELNDKNTKWICTRVPGAHFVYPVDLDNDGYIDILSASYDSGKIFWHENLGNFKFTTHTIAHGLGKTTSICALDIDNDTIPEIFSTSKTLNALLIHKKFSTGFQTNIVDGHLPKAYKIAILDFNGDKKKDLATSSFSLNGEISLFINTDDGKFKKIVLDHHLGGDIASIVPTDLDGDGKIDIVAVSAAKGRLFTLKNNGQNRFKKISLLDSFPNAFGLEATDMDHDGDIDIVVSSYSTRESNIAWLENRGSMHFQKHIIDHPWSPIPSLIAKDIDHDGDIDIIAALKKHNSIIWYENRGDQNFIFHTLAFGIDGVFNIKAVDLDGDGTDEIVAASYTAGTISWHALTK